MIVNPTLSHALKLAMDRFNFGHVLEFGVAAGTTLRQLIDEIGDDPYFLTFGFDSCIGLPEDWPGTVCKKGAFTNHGKEPYLPGVTKFYQGWFDDTLPVYCEEYPAEGASIALLHLDADLYSSTISVLRALNDRIKPGTVIVCDEWGREGDQACIEQERKAVWEWQETFGRELSRVEGVIDQSPCGDQRAMFIVIN